MDRTKGLMPSPLTQFAGIYNGKIRQIMINDSEAQFLTEQIGQSKMFNNKKFNGIIRTNMGMCNKSIMRNSYGHDSTTSSEQS
jgi:hypothetical protein